MPEKDQSKQVETQKNMLKPELNNPCAICRAMLTPPPCKGHARGGSGSGGGGKDGARETKTKNETHQLTGATRQDTNDALLAKSIFLNSLLSDQTNEYEAGLMSIESDRLRGHIIFRFKPGLNSDELESARAFLNAVKDAFDEFVTQLTEQGISVSNFSAVMQDNRLEIHIPNQMYFDAFIKHLDSRNLLPVPATLLHEKDEVKHDDSSQQERKRPSPFGDISKGPQP